MFELTHSPPYARTFGPLAFAAFTLEMLEHAYVRVRVYCVVRDVLSSGGLGGHSSATQPTSDHLSLEPISTTEAG